MLAVRFLSACFLSRRVSYEPAQFEAAALRCALYQKVLTGTVIISVRLVVSVGNL